MIAWAVAVALGAHVLYGYSPFPLVDDFAYAPLSEAWADPGLYPRDDQLHGYTNHAWVYTAVYLASKATIGVVTGFWIANVVLTVASVLALCAIMARFGVPGAGLPLALAIGVVVMIPGVGRGTFGGYVSLFFHHQWVALMLVMWAFAATLGRRPGLAGALLGAAAYAQPMSALHGAFTVAVAGLTQGRSGARALGVTAAAAIVVSSPVEYAVIASMLSEAGAPAPADRLAEDAYLFRAPHHYTLPPWPVLLGWGYLALGLISAALLRRLRPAEGTAALGLIAGLGVLLLVSTVFYFGFETRSLPILMLDATRSSPLLFAVSATLFATVTEIRAEAGPRGLIARPIAAFLVAAALATALATANAMPTGPFFALAGLLILAAPGRAVPKAAFGAVLAGLFVYAVPERLVQREPPSKDAAMFDWARTQTAMDALFIVPPGMMEFRLFAKRSVYANFKLFSVTQPAQAWLTRQRLEQIARPDPETASARGWTGIVLWDRSYLRNATCAGMLALMEQSGADYFVRPEAGKTAGQDSECGGRPAVAYADSVVTVFARDPANGRQGG